MITTMARCATLVAVMLLGQMSVAQTPASPTQAQVVTSVQKAAVAALNFRQGDVAGFNRARADFTSDGWKGFVMHMQGFLDSKGAPMFTSSFVPKHDARVLDEKNGVLHLRIPGTLTQSSNRSRTVYDRAAIEVYALYSSDTGRVKIQQLDQVTCARTSNACERITASSSTAVL